MPRRDDLKRILIIGSGPIVIGQACEFDYSGTQACKALREEGYEVILVNSNPATIMTDPSMANRTYIEPVDADSVARIIEMERPDAVLPTLGGQTGLNVAVQLYERGVLQKFGVKLIGANYDAIKKAEDRHLFREAMVKIGLKVPTSAIAYTMNEAMEARDRVGLPAVIRPSFTLGGTGGGIAYNVEEYERICAAGLERSLNSEILIEKSVAGWKEFELEVMRDHQDRCVIICGIENFDPMGVHTGDSITVAPIQTLSDREYQLMRDAAFLIMREIGVETGGSNVQFAVNPADGDMIVVEMNPRVSRSSALASKATGFPIARIAAKLAVGYTLDEIQNQITKKTPACFEPTLDYCVVKVPRWAFEKFPGSDRTLTTQMKSVGETMAIGRTFKEAMQKAIRSLEVQRFGFGLDGKDPFLTDTVPEKEVVLKNLSVPNPDRLFHLRTALKLGIPHDRIFELTGFDPWFLANLQEIVDFEVELAKVPNLAACSREQLLAAKRMGFSDVQLGYLWKCGEDAVRARRKELKLAPVYKLIDTCGAEFASETPYLYSTWEQGETEIISSPRKKIMILGGGPNRIGQGIEFDYCCVQAAYELRKSGFDVIMVNSNPETVSTDFDTSSQLFFEPLTLEDVIHIYETQKIDGVIVQFGGQTPLNLARQLLERGLPIIGTSPRQIDRAEDRKLFNELIVKLKLRQPESGIASNEAEAAAIAQRIGYPVLVRPSFVLGGRAMNICYSQPQLARCVAEAVEAAPGKPILIDRFLESALEIDVDVISDGKTSVVAGIMEHIEEAGIHSGDSTCVLPPHTISERQIQEIRSMAHALAKELEVVGLMNLQLAIKGEDIYVLEVNPRASRTVPFVGKAIGVGLAGIAAKVMAGVGTLQTLGFTEEVWPDHFSVKVPVFPFSKLPGTDTLLGPEMKSTGEVMGIDTDLGLAFAKGYLGANQNIPTEGKVLISVKDADKREAVEIAKTLTLLGFQVFATHGTYRALKAAGVDVTAVYKLGRGRPNVVDIIKNRDVGLVINTPSPEQEARSDEIVIRTQAVQHGIPAITTISGARAVVAAIHSRQRLGLRARALQDFHADARRNGTAAPH
ncbi:MAG: carbamoyl-phosphate synthase large subunit [Planctomycetes bacterium]|nr:carbamoyl-phosphate synthase large subunit [Planctomycetota bacterium]